MQHIQRFLRSVIVFIVILILGLFIGIARAEAPTLSKDELYNQQLGQWIEKLVKKESCGKGIIDTNGKWSRGVLCFQDGTYAQYSKKHNETDQRKLAIAMILDDYSNWGKWRCSVVKDTLRCPEYTWNDPIGLPPVYPQEKPV